MRRDSAVKLIDGLAGESPASADCPVGTVVISGDGAGDAAEFQKILDHAYLVWNEPIGALAHLGLARAYIQLCATTEDLRRAN